MKYLKSYKIFESTKIGSSEAFMVAYDNNYKLYKCESIEDYMEMELDITGGKFPLNKTPFSLSSSIESKKIDL